MKTDTIRKKIQKFYQSGKSRVECAQIVDDWELQGEQFEYAMNCVHDIYQDEDIFSDDDEKLYIIKNNRLYWNRLTRDGTIPTLLCNFVAHIASVILKDNGMFTENWFRISGTSDKGESLPIIDVKTSEFNSMNWVMHNWVNAIIEPGQNIKDRLRHAIQTLSPDAPTKPVYTHTGWRKIDDKHVFLTNGGGIGPDTDPVNVNVEIEKTLQKYILLPPIGDPVESFNASREFLNIGELPVTLPIWTAMYLAPLTELIDTAFTIWYVAASGSFKSVITALALNHFGSFDDRTLPASWRSTTNSLEKSMFLAKDLPYIIDDWHPGEDINDAKRLARTASDIVRAQGNRQGRQRMLGNLYLENGFIPRGLLISSGEQIPGGHSQNARMLVVEMEKSDIFRDKLTEAQQIQNRNRMNMAMSHYISWISRNWDELSMELPKLWIQKRDVFYQDDRHARLSSEIASLCTALDVVTRFGMEIGAIEDSDVNFLSQAGEDIFGKIVSIQGSRIESERPANRFITAMASMLQTDKVVLFDKDEEDPRPAPPGKDLVGWHDNNGSYYFDPDSAFKAVVQFCSQSGNSFNIKPDALWKDLMKQGISERASDGRTKVSTRIYGNPTRVIKIPRRFFYDN